MSSSDVSIDSGIGLNISDQDSPKAEPESELFISNDVQADGCTPEATPIPSTLGDAGPDMEQNTGLQLGEDPASTNEASTVRTTTTKMTPPTATPSNTNPDPDQSIKLQASEDSTSTNARAEEKEADGVADEISDGDDIDDFDESHRFKYKDLERRRQLMPKRIKQHNQYVNILEERISFLEERCDKYDKSILKEESEGKAPVTSADANAKGKPAVKQGLGFKQWKEFASTTNPTHVIDVLIGDPPPQKTERSRRRKASLKALEGEATGIVFPDDPLLDVSGNPTENCNLSEEIEKLKHGLFPERIRFNGNALPCVLRKAFSTDSSSTPDKILLRPFKPLLQRLDDVREAMSDVSHALKKVIEKRSTKDEEPPAAAIEATTDTPPPPPPPSLHVVTPDDKSSDAPDAICVAEWDTVLRELDLFHCCSGCTQVIMSDWPTLTAVEESFIALRKLIDEYLLPAHERLRKGHVQKVKFCDLWHLFLTGDTIVTKESAVRSDNEGTSLLGLKVLMTNGGRHVIYTASPAPYFLHAQLQIDATVDAIAPVNGINPFCIYAYYLDYNGSQLVPVRRRFIIPPYPNERPVTELHVFPIAYADDLQDVLKQRGAKFKEYVEARPAKYLDCKGLELRTREELNDKVIVDMKGYFSTAPENTPKFQYPDPPDISETSDCFMGNDCVELAACSHRKVHIISDQWSDVQIFTDYVEGRPEFTAITEAHVAQPQKETNFEICYYRLFAYKLRSREWVQVDVQDLEAPPKTDNGSGFDKLVLSPDHKQILQSQVHEHFRKRGLQVLSGSTEDDMDLVRGKGQGLIILLHGAPGVGKTCTAECIAELVMKPLYPITCGDLGSSAEDVEKNLKKHFTLASKWDCVMLLDEADVFLAKRKTEDLRRNSIVSVFLRILEYYKGLLFLTTNRVGTFDEAFKSRVHISLFYPNFDKKTTIKVWKTFIKQTKHVLESNGRTNVHINADEIKSFARKHWNDNPKARWNGRQIRNAFHTAVAMAEFDARESGKKVYDQRRDIEITIGKTQFEKIAKTASEFDSYMAETIGDTFDGVAMKEGVRKEQVKKPKAAKGKGEKKKVKAARRETESETDSEDEDSDERRGRKGTKNIKGKVESDETDSEDDSD